MDVQQLATLLLRLAARTPAMAEAATAHAAQQFMAAGNALAAVAALLPHSDTQLLQHAAQAGHILLLPALLSATTTSGSASMSLEWRSMDGSTQCSQRFTLLQLAAHAAAYGGQHEAIAVSEVWWYGDLQQPET